MSGKQKMPRVSLTQTGHIKRYYLHHLEKLRNAKSKVDYKPVLVNVNNFLRLNQITLRAHVIMENAAKNKHTIDNIFAILGKPRKLCAERKDLPIGKFKWRTIKNRFKKLQLENIYLHDRIKQIRTPKLATTLRKATANAELQVPIGIVEKFFRIIEMPESISLQNKIFRPRIYFELEALGERTFGRIIFQLYTEACPSLVLQMLRFFANGKSRKLRFPRLYSSLWAESEITLEKKDLEPINYYDLNALENENQSGILYFALQDINILNQGLLVFTINFRPFSVKDGKRLAFGKVIKGRSKFLCLNEYSTKSGKPLRDIAVTGMGVL